MKKLIYSLLLFVVVVICIPGCSDNYNELYEPAKTVKELSAIPESENYDETNRKLTLAATPSAISINVKSNTKWNVAITYPAESTSRGWCASSVINGSGDSTFDITVLENVGGEVRKCTVTISTIDAEGNILKNDDEVSYAINIEQKNSNVRLSPSSVEPFAANNPQSEVFQILADDNIEWVLALTCDTASESQDSRFMSVSFGNNVGVTKISEEEFTGKGNNSFTLILAQNRIAADRIGFITLKSDLGTYRVEIRQLGTEYTFDVSLDDYRAIPASGGLLQFGVYSPQIGWKIQGIPSWVSFDVTTGEALSSRITSTASVEPNNTGIDRSALITFMPVGTNSELYQKLDVQIVQSGSEDLALSAPWITGELGIDALTVRFSYYSIDRRILAAGIQWKKNDNNQPAGWNDIEDTEFDKNLISGFVTVQLTDLEAATEYLVRGYIVFDDGQVKYGPVCNPIFTTAGARPGANDNPRPGI